MSSRHWSRVALAGAGLAAIVAGFLTPIARGVEPDSRRPVYIALGDSFTSGPLLSKPAGKWGGPGEPWGNPENPYTCGRSDRNYPHLIAQQLGLYDPNDLTKELGEHPAHPGFIDISCGGARTKHIDQESQTGLSGGGTNPIQLSAFGPDRLNPLTEVVTLVTLGIGGNDLGFGELLDYCVQPPEATGGVPCRTHYERGGAGGGDLIDERLATLAPRIVTIINSIRYLASDAEVLVFGYPALLPEHRDLPLPELADGCYPYIPVLPTDVAYLRHAEKRLNETIRVAAESTGARYVDWYGPSIGHDMCAPPGIAWVNGAVLVPPSFPVHPNVLGTMGAAEAAKPVIPQSVYAAFGR